jgi:hypothetical protein
MTGAASSRCDYLATLGSLTFSPGETSKTISIPITDDAFVEGPENFNLTLANPVGATLGSPFTSQITINDNDNTPGVNPLDKTDFFVRQHYIDFLNREPDPSGFGFWTNEINSCGSNVQCIEVKRINVSAAFFLSIRVSGNRVIWLTGCTSPASETWRARPCQSRLPILLMRLNNSERVCRSELETGRRNSKLTSRHMLSCLCNDLIF